MHAWRLPRSLARDPVVAGVLGQKSVVRETPNVRGSPNITAAVWKPPGRVWLRYSLSVRLLT
ncbi:hypothetical protein D3C77_756250 [compost metagenome]